MKQSDLNPALAANYKRIAAGRGIGVVRQAMADVGLSIGGGTLARIAHGDPGVRIASLEKFATFARTDVDSLLRMPGVDDEFVSIDRIDVSVGAGPGKEAVAHETIGSLQFRSDFLRDCGITKPQDGKIVNVSGNSMYPKILDGAVLLINTSKRKPVDGEVFAFVHHDEGLIVKQALKVGDAWVAHSLNPDSHDIPIGEGSPAHIIGQAVWMGAKL
ncbi:helix-turn-helix transcriptional regulator [Ottowia flava]|uniref:Helix-turn-helix transcriptional regulator n=2 Tax=Ottowia TaxID=219181 RepID=A0ABW4KRI1_9BURK